MAEICMAKEAHFLCEETRLCACESALAEDTWQAHNWAIYTLLVQRQAFQDKMLAWKISNQQLQM